MISYIPADHEGVRWRGAALSCQFIVPESERVMALQEAP
jgi:hypothetical protein